MTKDEVEMMTDDELRIRAAFLSERGLGVGWGFETFGMVGGGTHLMEPDWNGIRKDWWEYAGKLQINRLYHVYRVYHNQLGMVELAVPDVLTNIGEAWNLAEKEGLSIIRKGKEWWVGKTKEGAKGSLEFTSDIIIDPSAPRAITRAFILAMTKEEGRR